MGFVQRAFTPPGTGDMSAVVAQQAAQFAAERAATAAKPPPSVPSISAAPPGPPQFSAGISPGAKQRAQVTASTMLGAAAAGGQQARKTATVLG